MAHAKVLSEASMAKVNEFIRESGIMYSVTEVAAILGKSPYTVARYAKEGLLNGGKINGRWYFTKEQIKEFMRGGEKDG